MKRLKQKRVASVKGIKKIDNLKKPHPAGEEEQRKENPFDFGGLPPINLKKNLGCG
ncbi:MAG: hypothetical protein JST43_00890 [Bacteroidetes bacterium]|nr:hypothetical protein [Bacteroidota bacterium]MBS1540686.1 hypothetical protein [Bacteroidota bacterium]